MILITTTSTPNGVFLACSPKLLLFFPEHGGGMLPRNMDNYQTTRPHIPENTDPNGSLYENVISCVVFC